MKDDDALSQKDGEWGGPREKKWEQDGKRAVVQVDPGLYSLVVMLASFCRRPVKSLNQQIYAAGLEALFGQSVATMESSEVNVVRPKGFTNKPSSHAEVRSLATKAFTFGRRR